MKSKTDNVKLDFFTRFLLGVAVFCPLFFFLCCAGLFTAEGGMSNPLDFLMATVAPVGYLAAGGVGFLASLFAVVRSKKRKAKRAVVYFAAALLVLNILTTPPAFYVASRIVQSI